MLKVIHKRNLVSPTAFGAVCLYKSCINDADLEARAEEIVQSALTKQELNRLKWAIDAYTFPLGIDRNIDYIASVIRKLEPLAPHLALLANGFDRYAQTAIRRDARRH